MPFRLAFSPVRLTRDDVRLTLAVEGDLLRVGWGAPEAAPEPYDFGPLAEGATLPRSAVGADWLASDVERRDGAIHLTVRMPHGPAAPPETLFPAPLEVETDGPVALPLYGDPPAEDPSEEAAPPDSPAESPVEEGPAP